MVGTHLAVFSHSFEIAWDVPLLWNCLMFCHCFFQVVTKLSSLCNSKGSLPTYLSKVSHLISLLEVCSFFAVFLRLIHSCIEPSCVLSQNPLNSNQKQWADTTQPWKILLNNSTLSRTATFMFCSNHQRKGYWFECKSPFSQKECYSLLLQQYFFLKNSQLYKHSNRICFCCCQQLHNSHKRSQTANFSSPILRGHVLPLELSI